VTWAWQRLTIHGAIATTLLASLVERLASTRPRDEAGTPLDEPAIRAAIEHAARTNAAVTFTPQQNVQLVEAFCKRHHIRYHWWQRGDDGRTSAVIAFDGEQQHAFSTDSHSRVMLRLSDLIATPALDEFVDEANNRTMLLPVRLAQTPEPRYLDILTGELSTSAGEDRLRCTFALNHRPIPRGEGSTFVPIRARGDFWTLQYAQDEHEEPWDAWVIERVHEGFAFALGLSRRWYPTLEQAADNIIRYAFANEYAQMYDDLPRQPWFNAYRLEDEQQGVA
jgi:hypothetical protein